MAEFTFYPEFAEYVALHHGVTSVNSKTGDVVLYGSDIPVSSTDAMSIDEKVSLSVIGPNSSVNSHIAIFDGTTGKVVKDSGYTINTSVPSGALFTDRAVLQSPSTANNAYELLFSETATNDKKTEGTKKTSSLTYNPSTKALITNGTVNGFLLAAASAKAVDTSVSSGSTNLPTSAAVVNYINNNIATNAEIDALFA